jgi:glycosyltransferase involved in cell wall biosynthesis
MYLLATHIPIYLDGTRTYVDDSWWSDLELARRFFVEPFGTIHVIGPQLPRTAAEASQMREIVPGDEIVLHPSIDANVRMRQYWPAASRQWARDLAPLVQQARVVHASVDDPFRPMQLAAIRAGIKANKTTVLIGFDMDVWDLLPVQLEKLPNLQGKLHIARTLGMDLWMRYCARNASVAMLKEGLVYDRYSPWAKNPREFCHSMHSEAHLISDANFDARIASLATGRPLRFGYFGRFIERKGLADAIRILAKARQRGVEAGYHLIGEGPQRAELEVLAAELGIAEHVVFEGVYPYGAELHKKLGTLDALLFTPTEEDTPRMVYDAFAQGLPLITTDIAFLRRRADRDGASILFDIGAIDAGAEKLVELNARREDLIGLSKKARERGKLHTVERWYGQRRDWTIEAASRNAS